MSLSQRHKRSLICPVALSKRRPMYLEVLYTPYMAPIKTPQEVLNSPLSDPPATPLPIVMSTIILRSCKLFVLFYRRSSLERGSVSSLAMPCCHIPLLSPPPLTPFWQHPFLSFLPASPGQRRRLGRHSPRPVSTLPRRRGTLYGPLNSPLNGP